MVPVLKAQTMTGDARVIVPLREYVTISPFAGGLDYDNSRTISRDELGQLSIQFDRDILPLEGGPQFVRIFSTVTNKDGVLLDQLTQYAFTFPREETPQDDARQMKKYADQISQFGFISRGRSDSVEISLDTLPDWGHVRIEVTPDEEYTKYTSSRNTRLVWHYRIRGNWLDSKFTLGIPKVIYDTHSADTVEYGNASALLRFFYLNQVTGKQFPVSFGLGLYGVSTPIDVSNRGGGFVFSLYFDVIQFLRLNGLDITERATAGLEIAPFFPVDHRARVLLSARIGYSP
jgi:hypothetical protein